MLGFRNDIKCSRIYIHLKLKVCILVMFSVNTDQTNSLCNKTKLQK